MPYFELKNFEFKLKENRTKKSWLFLTEIIVGIFVLNFLLLPFQNSLASSSTNIKQSYQIKLQDSKYYNTLAKVSDSIRSRFNSAKSPEFKNIYTFSSYYSLSFLQNYLQGEYVFLEPQRSLQTQAVISNDPGFTADETNIDKQWGLAKAGFGNAWDKTIGTKDNIIAVIDTGIDQTHEDLKSINFLPGYDFTKNQNILTGSNSDDNGHGTLVAGVLGATANNGLGITGTNWQVSIIPIKALDENGRGDSASVAEAIVWATDNKAQFINLSIGGVGFGHDTALANAVSYAFNKNVLVVAAAGNDAASMGSSLDINPVFPICDDNNYNMVIGVVAVDQNDLKPDFSNYGRNCVDVSAPGKRILSTISLDPLTKKTSPNSYAYASGTSLAVPFVVGQAALIKSLYPFATNVQIRDRVISTSDPIDNLNLVQCGGASCRGLLGFGRINVPKSLATAISKDFNENDLVKLSDTGAVYEIVGGQKRLVSTFVYNQRFAGAPQPKIATYSQLSSFPDGPYLTPTDGTLVKFDSNPTVYIMQNGQKLPITEQVFEQRNLSFSNVNTLSFSELESWPTSNFLAPVEGTLLKSEKSPVVYWVIGDVLHAINYKFFIDKGLNIFPIMITPENDISSFPTGESFIR